MTPRQARLAFLFSLLVLVTLALPSAAHAHRLNFDSDPNRPLYDYIWLGALHMLTGWDHLLFIIGVVLLAGSMRTAANSSPSSSSATASPS